MRLFGLGKWVALLVLVYLLLFYVAAITEKREVNGRGFMIIGEAIGQILAEELDDYPKVVIGWDRRPGNAMLVSGLTDGLHSSSVRVIHGGIVATPGLHDAVLGT